MYTGEKKDKWTKLSERAALCFLFFWLYFFIWSFLDIYLGLEHKQLESLSQYWDFNSWFSGVLFSLWAVLLFYASLRVQKEELKLTRDEISQTNKLYDEQKKQNLIFNLYNSQRKLFSSIYLSKTDPIQKVVWKYHNNWNEKSKHEQALLNVKLEQEVFNDQFWFQAVNIFGYYLDDHIDSTLTPQQSDDKLNLIILDNDTIWQQMLAYFRSMEFLINTIDKMIDGNDKEFFYNMVFSNLYECEKRFIFTYNRWKNSETKDIIKRYLEYS